MHEVVFLLDVDNTLLDNDRVAADYPPADVSIERIGDLLSYDLSELCKRTCKTKSEGA